MICKRAKLYRAVASTIEAAIIALLACFEGAGAAVDLLCRISESSEMVSGVMTLWTAGMPGISVMTVSQLGACMAQDVFSG